jgi:23S rRNA (adenine1618-N6)-methyltransferase
MGGGRKRRRRDGSEAPAIHPRNRYAAAAPDFASLASLYPSFAPFVSVSRGGRASIDFTDFAATRELTRVLLLHDHGVNWLVLITLSGLTSLNPNPSVLLVHPGIALLKNH